MRKQILPIIVFTSVVLLFVVFVFFYAYNSPCETLESSNGYYDLSEFSYNSDFVYSLEGNWNYENLIDDNKIVNLPDAISRNSGETVYSVHVKLPKKNEYYSIFIPRICADFKLVINGTTIYENGIYASKISYINSANTYSFYSEADELDIELYTYALSALPYKALPIAIGAPAATNVLFLKICSVDVLLLIIMISSGIYFLVLVILDRNRRSYGAFALLCFIMAFRCSVNNIVFLGLQFPRIPNAIIEFIIPLITPLLLIAIIFFTNTLYEKCFNTVALSIDIILCVIYMVLAPFFNYVYFDKFLIFYNVLIVYTSALLFFTGIKYIHQKKQNASAFILSAFIMLGSSILESTFNLISPKFGHALNIGFVFYIILQTNTFLVNIKTAYSSEIELSKSYDNTLATAKEESTNFLSSHLKPHFIFNSLNVISGYALFEPEKAKKICSSLVTYMKQMFEHNNMIETNTLENEINLAKAFGYIETERFPNITIDYDISDGIEDTVVPALLIQPLLENAVNHGIRKRSAKIPGNISISINKINNYVHFIIHDDGVGMDEETIRAALQRPSDDKYHGLFHLSLRLGELYYEELNIESSPDAGTTISFKIPR